MRFLKNAALLILAGGLLTGSYFILSKGPCDSPLTYRIGQFDPKFGVSQADFQADIAAADKIWETQGDAGGRKLFAYDPHGTLPINLVYDTRQATVDTNKQLAASVDQTVASADTVKSRFLALKSEYDQSKADYQAAADAFQSTLDSYNAEVASWNARGGAPAPEYTKLQDEKSSLENLRNDANAKMLAANDLVRQVNALVDQYNSIVTAANVDVKKINQSADSEFEAGEYISDAQGARINVYEFDSTAKLVRLLAHEMGHSLGLGHNSNPQSIMYYLNNSTSLVLSTDDIKDLKAACKLP